MKNKYWFAIFYEEKGIEFNTLWYDESAQAAKDSMLESFDEVDRKHVKNIRIYSLVQEDVK